MSEPLVSVCIPCHNAALYVAEALESVLGQTYPNIEIVVVDDASTDHSREVLRLYEQSGVTVIEERCGTASRARNRALREARGDFVKFFDADDLLSAECLAAQVGRLVGHGDDIASARWGRFVDGDLGTLTLSPEANWKDMESTDWLVESCLGCRGMMQCGMFLIPRRLLERIGGWNENLTLIDDFEFFSRLLCASRNVLFCPEATLCYRSNLDVSLSARKSRGARESECDSLLMGTGHLLARRSDAKARLACANVCQHLIFDLYPQYPDLRAKLAARVAECGGAEIEPSGGSYFQMLRRFIGWKLARRLQRACGR